MLIGALRRTSYDVGSIRADRPRTDGGVGASARMPTRTRRRSSPVGGGLKRCFDIAVAGLGLIATSPLIAAAAIATKFTDRGPLFYGHTRIGCRGHAFCCFKIRTMAVDGETILARHLAENPAAAAEWAETLKLRDDPRVTPLGRFLRRSSLDELPQLFNILRGDMSIVGPRPITEQELERYGESAVSYLAGRPGLTGLWQVSGRSDLSYDARVALDAHYVTSWSFTRDVLICLKTVPAVAASRGSY